MGIEDFQVGFESEPSGHCIVCGKSVDHGGGMARINVEGSIVAICCPLCYDAFTKNPKHYLLLRDTRQSNKPKDES